MNSWLGVLLTVLVACLSWDFVDVLKVLSGSAIISPGKRDLVCLLIVLVAC